MDEKKERSSEVDVCFLGQLVANSSGEEKGLQEDGKGRWEYELYVLRPRFFGCTRCGRCVPGAVITDRLCLSLPLVENWTSSAKVWTSGHGGRARHCPGYGVCGYGVYGTGKWCEAHSSIMGSGIHQQVRWMVTGDMGIWEYGNMVEGGGGCGRGRGRRRRYDTQSEGGACACSAKWTTPADRNSEPELRSLG